MSPASWALAADAMMSLHFLLVLFVIGVPLALPWGWRKSRGWARGWTLRIVHLAVLAVVVLQSWAGWLCPLTIWEQQLRRRSGGASWEGDFIAHWIERLLYVDAPAWAFTIVYSAFLALVVLVNLRYPPRAGAARRNDHSAG